MSVYIYFVNLPFHLPCTVYFDLNINEIFLLQENLAAETSTLSTLLIVRYLHRENSASIGVLRHCFELVNQCHGNFIEI